MKRVFDTLDRESVVVAITDPLTKQPVKVTVNKYVMQRVVSGNLGTTTTGAFPAFFERASRGIYEEAAHVWLNTTRESLGSAMAFMMDCSSGATAARLQRIEREASATLLGSVPNDPFPGVCDAWNATDLGDGFRAPVHSDIPVLFISGTMDERAPVRNAEEYRPGLPNSAHLILDGAVHGDPLFVGSPRIAEVMLEFMQGQPLSTIRIPVQSFRFSPIAGARQP
jgi:pimeloyl-ACP methyl ester carboxylesterase